MKQLSLKQGSQEWLKVRASHFTASEASAMLGVSKYMSRTELLDLKKTGIAKEVDAATQARFDKGHAVEELARPIVEKILGDDLYPVTGSLIIEGLPLLASFDGLTLMEDTVFEHKLNNKTLKQSMIDGVIPEQYRPQLEQQLLVSSADRVIFACSNGIEEGLIALDYYPDVELRQRILLGWKQFAIDLETHEVKQAEAKPETKPLMELPALSIAINGEVSSSNLELYKSTALEFIAGINTDLQTDDDFAIAEVTIKFCDNAEKELQAVKKQALSQTADIDMLFKTVDHLAEELRQKRLTLNKLVKSQKEQIKFSMVTDADNLFQEHVVSIHKELNGLHIPRVIVDFAGAIKGKRNLASMRDAVETELARVKIEANQLSDAIWVNAEHLSKYGSEYKFLFNDMQSICTKDKEDFINLFNSRIAQHKEAEAKRLEAEREQIRIQEQQKAEQAKKQELEEERQRIRAEEQEKTRIEEVRRIEAENIEMATKRREEERHQKLLDKHEQRTEHELCCSGEFQSDDELQGLPLPKKPNKNTVKTQDKMISITVSEYNKLTERSEWLSFLELAGVDNWSGFCHAQELRENSLKAA